MEFDFLKRHFYFFKKEDTKNSWKRVLHEIYSYGPHGWGVGKKGFTDGHPLAKKLGISGHVLMLSLSFLRDQKLIEYDKRENNWIRITDKGFDVALKNESNNIDLHLKYGSLVLSVIIGLAVIFSFIYELNRENGLVLYYAFPFSIVIIYAVYLYYSKKHEL